MRKSGLTFSLGAASLLAAIWFGFRQADTKPAVPAKPTFAQPPTLPASAASPTPASNGSKLTAGDPVDRLRSSKTRAEREEIMGAFMTLGHARNLAMLIDALRDESVELRVQAVEYAAALTPAESALVLREAVLNENKDVRDMGWSLLASHPLESKVPVIASTIERGSAISLEEMFSEMGRTPERPLFEAMLMAAGHPDNERQSRLLHEMQEWLKPGGGDVPRFQSVGQLTTWWKANRQRYDQFMLRVDL